MIEPIYIARANTLITKKGELWEMSFDMTYIIHKSTRSHVPVKLIQNFDKHFIALFDPKTYLVGATKIYVTKAGININGQNIDTSEWCHYTDLYDKPPFKVQVVKYLGMHLTIELMKQITEYFLLLQAGEANGQEK